MESDTHGHQTLRFGIIRLTGKISRNHGVLHQFIDGSEQRCHISLLRQRRGELRHLRGSRQRAKPADGIGVQRADSLGDLIDRYKQFLVLGLKRGVPREKSSH